MAEEPPLFAKVLASHVPETDTEIAVAEGSEVRLVEQLDENWIQVDTGKEIGAVPINILAVFEVSESISSVLSNVLSSGWAISWRVCLCECFADQMSLQEKQKPFLGFRARQGASLLLKPAMRCLFMRSMKTGGGMERANVDRVISRQHTFRNSYVSVLSLFTF